MSNEIKLKFRNHICLLVLVSQLKNQSKMLKFKFKTTKITILKIRIKTVNINNKQILKGQHKR